MMTSYLIIAGNPASPSEQRTGPASPSTAWPARPLSASRSSPRRHSCGMQPARSALRRRPGFVALYANPLLAAARAGDVVGVLHSHERVHIDAERLLEAQG